MQHPLLRRNVQKFPVENYQFGKHTIPQGLIKQNHLLKEPTAVQATNSHHISSLLSTLHHCQVHTLSGTLKKPSRAIRVHNWSLAKPGVKIYKHCK